MKKQELSGDADWWKQMIKQYIVTFTFHKTSLDFTYFWKQDREVIWSSYGITIKFPALSVALL